ncbi:MAG: alpha/beta fold hydrolase [Hyphomicrobiaceae bacterium]
MPRIPLAEIDILEDGSGPPVVLVHSSVSGARQWRKLITVLAPSFHVRAPNLIGYGRTPEWAEERAQTLDDQAEIIETLAADTTEPVNLVGHSLGGTVAMKAAQRLRGRIEKLVLLEPNPFFLLRDNGRTDAFREIMELHDIIKTYGGKDQWTQAAACFADYWGGTGTWADMPSERRSVFAEALKPNFHEWGSVLGEHTELATIAEALPERTLVVSDPATARPIREIVELLQGATAWQFITIPEGGHMAPLARPDLINPIVERFLLD